MNCDNHCKGDDACNKCPNKYLRDMGVDVDFEDPSDIFVEKTNIGNRGLVTISIGSSATIARQVDREKKIDKILK